MEKKISVIVPIYNVEKYLETCIKSICNQTYDNLEIILVDDGSTDKSLVICNDFAMNDNRIKVFPKPNGGLVSARKYGVEKAVGDMIAFVDGDDWIEHNMYEKMLSTVTSEANIHLITSGLKYEWEDREKDILDGLEEGIYSCSGDGKRLLYNLIYDEQFSRQNILTSVCNKLFDANILKRAICSVDDAVTLGEDGVLLCNFVAMADYIRITHYVGYHYIQHESSMIHKNNFQSFEKIYNLKKCFEDSMDSLGLKKKMKKQIDHYTKCFLDNVVRDVYDIKNTKTFFAFPYDDLPEKTKVIIYGFGQVGYSYWKYINDTKCMTIVGRADKDYLSIQEYGEDVYSIDSLIEKDYDYIIVAVENEETACNIKKDLCNLNVDEEKILWRPIKWKIW